MKKNKNVKKDKRLSDIFKNKKNVFELIKFSYVMISLLFLLFYSYKIAAGNNLLMKYEKTMVSLSIIGIVIYFHVKIKSLKFKRFELFIFGLAIFSFISYLFAVNKDCALWGAVNRREGLYAYLFYYVIALVTSTIESKNLKKILILEIVLIGFVNLIYGLLQTGRLTIPNVKSYGDGRLYAKGLNGNSMNYASILALSYPIFAGLFVCEKNYKKAIIYGLLTCLFTFGLLISGSMAVIVSSICMFIFMLLKQIIIIYKNSDKQQIITLAKVIIVIIIFILTNTYLKNTNRYYKGDINIMTDQAKSIVSGDADDSVGGRRIYIWKKSLENVKKYPLTGIGIDNYRYGFKPIIQDPKNGQLVTKAHNDYIQRIVCEGVISGVFYIVFLAYIFFKNIKNNDRFHYALLLSFICYSVQMFFGISTTRVTPVYYVLLGLLMFDDIVLKKNKKKKAAKK